MKQKIYPLGLITTGMIFLGGMMKLNHWPGAFIFLILGILMLIFVFLPLALINHYRTEGNRQNLALYIVTWLTCLVVFGGMLFKIQHWAGAGIAMMIALPFPFVVFLPVFLIVTGRNKNFSIYNTVYVLLLLAGISVFSALLSLNISKDRIDDSLNLSRNYNRLESVLAEVPVPSQETPMVQKIDELIKTIDDYQSRIFSKGGITEEQWNKDQWSYTKLDLPEIATNVLVIGGKTPSLDRRLEDGLKSLITEAQKSAGYEDLASKAPLIFDYYESTSQPNDWFMGKFFTTQRAWSLIYLDGLETNLKMIRVTMK